MIEQLITDEIFLKLQSAQNKKNIFDIVGQTHTEHWHSAFICWLLSPDADHNLETFALNRLLALYAKKAEESHNNYYENVTFSDILDMDYTDFTFKTEQGIYGKAQGSIDILGKGQDYIVVIENKVDANERTTVIDGQTQGQTYVYYDYFSNNKKYNDNKKLYIYLTASNTEPLDKHFMKITYQEFYDSVISKCFSNPNVDTDAKYLIEQYIFNLRKKSNKTNQPLALTAKAECAELYRKYESLLNDIFDKVKKQDTESAEFKVYGKYKAVFDEIYLSEKNMLPTLNLKGEELVKYLVMTKKIAVGDEFYHKGTGCVFETDLHIDSESGQYYFIAGIKNEGAITDSSNADGFAHYRHFKEAAQAVQDFWNKTFKGVDSQSSIDGTTWWHYSSEDGPTPRDLQ